MFVRSLAAAVLLGLSVPAAGHGEGDYFIHAHFTSQAQLERIAVRFQHLDVDREKGLVRAEASSEDIHFLQRSGLRVEVDEYATSRMRAHQLAATRAGGVQSIPGFACYRTVEETYEAMDAMAATAPGFASVIDIGPSWERSQDPQAGYEMRVLKLTNSATDVDVPDKPAMVMLSALHAREYTTAELTTRFAEQLLAGYGSDAEATWLLDNFEFHFILQANPDGRKRAESGISWRKNTNDLNGACPLNADGIDLNRNFVYGWGGTANGSSGNPCATTYRGPTAASEPETRNIIEYVAGTPDANGVYQGGVFPDRRNDDRNAPAPVDYQGLFFDNHSFSKLVLWSWGDTNQPTANGTAMRTLGRRLAWFNGYRPQQAIELYPTDGTTDDTFYGKLGVPSYTYEFGISFFEDCDTFHSQTLPDNLASMRYAARSLRAPYLLPSGPDTTAVSVDYASVVAGTTLTVTATVDDRGFNQSNGSEPVHDIVAAEAFLGTTPWDEGAVPIPLQPLGGAFDGPVAMVAGSINTAGLPPGRHLVFVQGIDASGARGTPNAAMFMVGDVDNQAPDAAFDVQTDGLQASFTDLSTDPDGDVASWSWDFGDGNVSTQRNPVHAYSATGTYIVSLDVEDDQGASATTSAAVSVVELDGVLANGEPVGGLAASGGPLYFRLDVPEGASKLRFSISGGTGDADLYVRHAELPTLSAYDCRPYLNGNEETCGTAAHPIPSTPGPWFVMIHPYTAFSGVTLVGGHEGGLLPPGPRELTAEVQARSRMTRTITLAWVGGADEVDVHRNGSVWQRVANTGSLAFSERQPGVLSFRVCDAGSSDCSAEVTADY